MVGCNKLNVGDWVPPQPQRQILSEYREYDIFKIADALRQRSADSEPEWFTVGRILHQTDPALFPLFKQWSQTSGKYQAGDCERLWQRYAHEGENYSGPLLTLGSLFYGTTPNESNEYKVYNLEEFLGADFKIEFLIDRCLVKDQTCIIGAGKKTLKTTLGLESGLSLAHGVPFLGLYEVARKTRVLFMSGESGEGTLQETAARMIKAKGIKVDKDYFHITPEIPYFYRPLDKLERLLVNRGIEVLYVDPVYLAMSGNEANNLIKVGSELRPISELCKRLGITPILLHHTTKSSGADNRSLDLNDLQWSGFAEFCRQWWLINRRAAYIDGSGEHKLHLSIGGSAGHSVGINVDVSEGVYPDRYWHVEVKTFAELEEKKQIARYESNVEAVRTVFKANQSRPLSKTSIRDAAGIRSQSWPDTFQRMITDGLLVPTNEKKPRYRLGELENERSAKAA
jgi:hypothetical protein